MESLSQNFEPLLYIQDDISIHIRSVSNPKINQSDGYPPKKRALAVRGIANGIIFGINQRKTPC